MLRYVDVLFYIKNNHFIPHSFTYKSWNISTFSFTLSLNCLEVTWNLIVIIKHARLIYILIIAIVSHVNFYWASLMVIWQHYDLLFSYKCTESPWNLEKVFKMWKISLCTKNIYILLCLIFARIYKKINYSFTTTGVYIP